MSISPLIPNPIKQGDVVTVVSPGSPVARAKLDAGLDLLRQRYQVRVSPGVYDAQGYLAGSDDRRFNELAQAMLDPDTKAIFASRGGYGTTRIEADLPWRAFARHPKWIVGFSDITALHVEASRRGIASLHAPMVSQWIDLPGRQQEVFSLLEAPLTPLHFTGLEALVRGRTPVSGVLIGGNLTLLQAMAAAGRLRFPEHRCILAIEDEGEAPYRVDRMLTSLRVGGHLDHVAGIVLGSWLNCNPQDDGVTVFDAIASSVPPNIPVYKGAPFGHDSNNHPFVLGAPVTLKDGELVSHQPCDPSCLVQLFEAAAERIAS